MIGSLDLASTDPATTSGRGAPVGARPGLPVAVGLLTAAAAFVAYPALRPAVPEEGLVGAAGFASDAWLTAHALGMLGFIALAVALRSAERVRPWPWSGRPLRELVSRVLLGVALILPYYGAEAFGLHAVGRYAVATGDAAASAAVMGFRFEPVPVAMFGIGLLLLALAGARLVIGLRRAPLVPRLGGLLAGVGLLTYLPQFFLPMPGRIVHGVVLGAGLLLLAHGSLGRSRSS